MRIDAKSCNEKLMKSEKSGLDERISGGQIGQSKRRAGFRLCNPVAQSSRFLRKSSVEK